MDTDSVSTETTSLEETTAKTGRPPQIIITSAVNLIHLQKQQNNVVEEEFEFRTTRNGTKIITRGMMDSLGVKSHLETNNFSYFTFYPKSEKPIKAVIRHLPVNTSAEDICEELVSLGCDVVKMKRKIQK
jgi:hypothetical protein